MTLQVTNQTGRIDVHDNSMAIDFDCANDGQPLERTNALAQGLPIDISSDENSDDDLYLSLSESDMAEPVVSQHPTPVEHKIEETQGSQKVNAFVGQRSSADIQTKTTSRKPAISAPSLDLSKKIKGMYRILDLISEEGSGGLVDKIIIAQDSLRDFINMLVPGAYVSLTKVNFKALDKLSIKPLGVYGSKQEIVKFLLSIHAIDVPMSQELLAAKDEYSGSSSPALRSGLYIVRSFTVQNDEQLFILYWPQETTWNDSAILSVQRNRVTFIRYLTKICDQVAVFISSEHAKTLVWGEDYEDNSDAESDDSDRLHTFEVAKTLEQEENVFIRPGFQMASDTIQVRVEMLLAEGLAKSVPTPKLLRGEINQGFMTAIYVPPGKQTEVLSSSSISQLTLKGIIKSGAIHLSRSLDDNAVRALIDGGLRDRFPAACDVWIRQHEEARKKSEAEVGMQTAAIKERIASTTTQLENLFREAIVAAIITKFPIFNREHFGCLPPSHDGNGGDDVPKPADELAALTALFPKIGQLFEKTVEDAKLDSIESREFKTCKKRLVETYFLLAQRKDLDLTKRQELIRSILVNNDPKAVQKILHGFNGEDYKETKSRLMPMWTGLSPSHLRSYFRELFSPSHKLIQQSHDITDHISDLKFLQNLKNTPMDDETLKKAVTEVQSVTQNYFNDAIPKLLKGLVHRAIYIQQEETIQQVKREASDGTEKDANRFRTMFIGEIEKQSQSEHDVHTHIIDTLERTRYGASYYYLSGRKEWFQDHGMEYTIHVMKLTAEDQQDMQLKPTFIPSPNVDRRFSHSFRLPVEHKIEHSQLLENERLLLVVADCDECLLIYLDKLSSMDESIKRGKHRSLRRQKIGPGLIVAYEESKRILVLCASEKLILHVYVYDEGFGSSHASGSTVDLVPWYNKPSTTISHVCFVCGSQEILLVDSDAQARIFSLITLQFRPAVLQLQKIPVAVHSSPDGSCLLIADIANSETHFTAYHWGTFGSTPGIPLGALDLPAADTLVLTSFNRKSIHLMGLDVVDHRCRSVALDITRKVTEFMFKEKDSKSTSRGYSDSTLHNSLIDCHAEVWTRFPVLPAVQRQTISSLSTRYSKTLVFVTDRDHRFFASYFSDMIQRFDRTTRKPTGGELRRIHVSANTFDSVAAELTAEEWGVSRFRAGEWLVDCLCLIPIHIAITKENRFVPLKDGVLSSELEKSLLGAEVGRIVDSLSFGWYESLFQSYMASKPVKVVSSMGEQSVGKSFTLNHLVDTSFAGSAMRTTEGVWMSVTPTDEILIVALDFEGVHSIERSAQEDTLLVLFNTAISNLVLFRNNFALNRDISGLFRSFQSSSTVLNPSANPSLFQSTLVIIIKDVVTSDKEEIKKEFSLKFQRIVEDEQDANFISRLHNGKLDIIPWPVIESKEFYKLFPKLKRRLDHQPMTHHTGGEFLDTMKTLMAKLKANDWGSLSQTMAARRAQLLLNLLSNAMSTGFTEVEPDHEPLKNFDTDILVDKPDSSARFFISANLQHATREQALSTLRNTWDQVHSRQQMQDGEWISRLSVHLDRLAEMRIEHVREWITLNLSRFQTGHANIEDLRRTFESVTVDLKAGVQLCKTKCASCHLLCVLNRLHDGAHNCQTSHECIYVCDFCDDDAGERKHCTMAAGHPGKHICVINAHLCGEPCKLAGKQGCLEECTKVVGHTEEDHMCAASVHTCGEPCRLTGIKLADGTVYSCTGICCIPSDVGHEQHLCDARLCPVACELCKRLCANQDHLHGLNDGAIHLCGQEHSCTALCTAPGVCEIDTAPQSIEATFTGRHDTFKYTKYSQVAKRLKCVKPIAPGTREHQGAHSHSNDHTVFHFCTTRCESCEYYCTLPLGHPQQEHETSHGSMSKTRWAVDGPDGTSLELKGRKFSSNDDGAPMMCNLVCLAMGRHVHVDYCRAQDGTPCDAAEVQHISTRMSPNPDRFKDFVTHSLHWKRTGFKDPYPRDDQENFFKCDAMCGGHEHSATEGGSDQPSYCTLPVFHAPRSPNSAPAGPGYVSNDGHIFLCKDPASMQQLFHVIFVIDRSSSMGACDRKPLPNTPVTRKIVEHANNRLGAVYSALHSFWSTRHTAISVASQSSQLRQDAYSVILFNHKVFNTVTNDITRSSNQLLEAVLPYGSSGLTDFTIALQSAQTVMEENFSTERSPVIIFLSDGECNVSDQTIQDLCRSAVRLGKPLSFHAVSFGQDSRSSYLRRMARIALDIQNTAPRDPLTLAASTVLSSYSQALDTVRLAETFLGIAESLRKPRGSLLC